MTSPGEPAGPRTPRLAIVADHNGITLKAHLVTWLRARGHEVDDRGGHDRDVVVDYPPLCADVCGLVVAGAVDRAVVLGGSGQGETIACNKIRGIRAGLCQTVWDAGISRGNNDANVLVLGAKILSDDDAEAIVATWLDTPFKGGVHGTRVDMIAALERGEALQRTDLRRADR